MDNLTVDNLKIDTDRDGIDLDCCRNVRVSNCTVNSPWDDGICPKSSFALGYPRATENLTITNCFVTGGYELGSVLDGSWKHLASGPMGAARIKCGTESNGGVQEHHYLELRIRKLPWHRIRDGGWRAVRKTSLLSASLCAIPVIRQYFSRSGSRMRGA